MVKNPPANVGDIRDAGLSPGSGRSPGDANGNPFQYSCLENSMDREAWQATVCGVTKSQTQLSDDRKVNKGCHSKIPHNGWLINNGSLFLTFLEAGKSKIRHQQI